LREQNIEGGKEAQGQTGPHSTTLGRTGLERGGFHDWSKKGFLLRPKEEAKVKFG
jgi:hypothetical protein